MKNYGEFINPYFDMALTVLIVTVIAMYLLVILYMIYRIARYIAKFYKKRKLKRNNKQRG